MRQRKHGGFTLIEMMVAIAMLGILLAWLGAAEYQANRLAVSEDRLRRGIRAMENQVEILSAASPEELAGLSGFRFTPEAGEPALPGLAGEVGVAPVAGLPGVLRLDVTVKWQDPRLGERSVHTTLLKNARRRP